MKQTLTQPDVLAALRKQAEDLTARADDLRELDAAIGDGDLGITVTIGFQAVCETLLGIEGADLSTLLMRSGMAFNRKAASTFGALYATMMMRAARVAKGVEAIGASEFGAMLSAAVEGVQERGKAQRGDKTMLDALIPAAEAAMAAAKYRVDNLTAILDYNKYQQTGPVAEVMPSLAPVADKWQAFGWHVVEIDGHDMEAILWACNDVRQRRGRPQIIIAHTLKGKGLSPFEQDETNRKHGVPLEPDEAEVALAELDRLYGRA